MSTPYTPVGGTQAGEFEYDYDDAGKMTAAADSERS